MIKLISKCKTKLLAFTSNIKSVHNGSKGHILYRGFQITNHSVNDKYHLAIKITLHFNLHKVFMLTIQWQQK